MDYGGIIFSHNNKSYVFSDARFPTHDEQLRIQEKGNVPWGRRGSQWALARSCLRSAHRIFARGGQVVLTQLRPQNQTNG